MISCCTLHGTPSIGGLSGILEESTGVIDSSDMSIVAVLPATVDPSVNDYPYIADSDGCEAARSAASTVELGIGRGGLERHDDENEVGRTVHVEPADCLGMLDER